MADTIFRVGDIVTRTGTDRHVVTGVWPEDGVPALLDLRCTRAPNPDASGWCWCEVGDVESNLPRRYTLVERAS